MTHHLSEQQWLQYYSDGYIKLGKLLNDEDLSALQNRINQVMLGEADLDYSRLMMQLDSETGNYEDAGEQSLGFKEATLNYRKIEKLEYDPLFLTYMQRPIFREICDRVYGSHTSIACFRAMFMNKPANRGTMLPWHQDRWVNLDRDPLITVWTALDPATRANGCVQVIRGSHSWGVINPEHPSGFLTPELAREHAPSNRVEYLELEPGEVMLLHNWLLHSSDRNHTDVSRRAFSVCYMDARTRDAEGLVGTTIFGAGALTPEGVAQMSPAAI